MKTYLPAVLIAASLALLPGGACAEDYKGADAILKILDAGEPAQGKPLQSAPGPRAGESAAKIRSDLAAYRKTAANLAPAKAAKGWLDLAVRFVNYDGNPGDLRSEVNEDETFDFGLVVASLPPPAAWDEMAKQVAALPAGANDRQAFRMLALKLLVHRLDLKGDVVAKDLAALNALEAKIKPASGSDMDFQPALDGLQEQLLEEKDEGTALLKEYNGWLATVSPDSGPQTYHFGDIASRLGNEKAAEFLRRAMRTNIIIDFDGGGNTIALAQRLALEMVPEMKVPQWVLVAPGDTKLYEALAKRFPPPFNVETSEQRAALANYFYGLVAEHRLKEVAALAEHLKGTDFFFSAPEEDRGDSKELADFYHDQLAKNPDLPFWDDYIKVARRAGREDEMFALLQAAAARDGLDDRQKNYLLAILQSAYFTADRFDDGIAILRKEIEAWNQDSAAGKPDMINSGVNYSATSLMEIGRALGRKDLFEEGLRSFLPSPDLKKPGDLSSCADMVTMLIGMDCVPEAESLVARFAANANAPWDKMGSLSMLVTVYHYADRPADELKLLDTGRYWYSSTLGIWGGDKIAGNVNYSSYYIASALAGAGRKAEAARILYALLDAQEDYEPAYELLVKIAPRDELLARLDALAARDKLEPQPLIWKAKALFDAGKLDQAETAARKAIARDPLDCKQGTGRRMKAYEVLADIREARGDKKEAASLRGVVTANRHAEKADELWGCGLLSRAIKGYEEALTHCEGDFRIQFQLASLMEEAGDMAGAEEHYRRAYELMPASFECLDNSCEGCEPSAFPTGLSRSVGDKVVPALVKQHPGKPEAHYLLGLLRFYELRSREALPELREAVRLKPDYIDAWKILSDIARPLNFPIAQRDAITIQLARLDPLEHHRAAYQGDISQVADLKSAWNVIDAAWKSKPPPPPKSLYPLPAATKEMEKEEKEGIPIPAPFTGLQTQGDPGHVIARNGFIGGVIALIDSGRQPIVPSQIPSIR